MFKIDTNGRSHQLKVVFGYNFVLVSYVGSGQFSRSVVSDFLQPHGLQHARPPCPSPTPGFTQTHVHQVGDAIQPSHPLSFPCLPHVGISFLNKETCLLSPITYTKHVFLIGKDPDAGKDWGQEKKGTTEGEMDVWHHRLNGHEFDTRGCQSLEASLSGCWNSRCACQLDSSTPGSGYGGGHSFPPGGPGSF